MSISTRSREHLRRAVRIGLLGCMVFGGHSVPAQAPHVREALDVAVEDEAGPWSRKDGTGFANDVVKAAFAAGGVDVHVVVMPYARCKQMVVSGDIAACWSMSPYPGRSDHVRFAPAPLFTMSSVLVESADRPPTARGGVATRRDMRVGAVLGYEYPDSMYAWARAAGVRFDFASSENINLRKLVAHRVDGVIININDLKTVDHVLTSAGVVGRVRATLPLGAMPAYIGFSLAHPRAEHAMRAYLRGLDLISRNGELARIHAQWNRRLQNGKGEPH